MVFSRDVHPPRPGRGRMLWRPDDSG